MATEGTRILERSGRNQAVWMGFNHEEHEGHEEERGGIEPLSSLMGTKEKMWEEIKNRTANKRQWTRMGWLGKEN
jgi:hypothetical protein